MLRITGLILLLLLFKSGFAQRSISRTEAVQLAFNNQRNLKAAGLTVQQQQQLLRSASQIQNPQVFAEASPYEPLVLGVQQTFSLPGVYKNRRSFQNQNIRLAQLQLQGSQYELKRAVLSSYLQLQFFHEKQKLLAWQDSLYQDLKISAKRFFDAGQINKLEELQSATQADRITNELERVRADLNAEMQIFLFYTGSVDSLSPEPLNRYDLIYQSDTAITNIQQQILQQQTAISESALKVERSELLPQVQAGVLFPATNEYERAIGYQVGVTIPIWIRQNRNRIAAAKTGIEIARAQQELEQQRLNAQYRQALANYRREAQSLSYFNNIALPQARLIIETSRRLFLGGELNYIESLRNLQTAFTIFTNHLDTHREYNEAVIQLNYLNGTL